MKTYEVVVIGNGMLGTATAFALLKKMPDLSLALIGEHDRSFGATVAAGAMLNVFGEVTTATFSSPYHQTKFNIGFESSKKWAEWLEYINQSQKPQNRISVTRGTYIILNSASDAMDSQNFAAIIQALKEYREPFDEVDPRFIPGLKPAEHSQALRAIYIPNENAIYVKSALVHFEKLIKLKSSASLIDAKVDAIEVRDSHQFLLRLGQSTIKTKNVIIAAGSFSQALLDSIPDLKEKIPLIVYGIGTAFTTLMGKIDIKNIIRTPNRGLACGIHAVPYAENLLYIGASNFISPFPVNSNLTSSLTLLQGALEQINSELCQEEIQKWYLGSRPITIDTFPTLGPTSIPGLWLMTGTYRDGIHAAPVLSTLLANQYMGEAPGLPEIFRPERKPISTLTQEESIHLAIQHYMSGSYQHGLRMPKMRGWKEFLNEAFYSHFMRVYEKLGIDFGVPPEILIMFSRQPKIYLEKMRDYYQKIGSRNS
jgi:glycine/D-amino acid oxidase-like deaminating enzyme